MNENIDIKDCFCYKYLGNKELFPKIERQTVEVLFNNGFDSFPTLIAMDFEEDLPQLSQLNFGQKALIRRALTLLHSEYDDNYFDYKNEFHLKRIFNIIDRKLHPKPNGFKSDNNYQYLSDLNLNSTKDVSNSEDIDVSNSEDMVIDDNHLIEDMVVSEVNVKQENLTNGSVVKSEQNSDKSDVKSTDWTEFKRSINPSKYERLKKTCFNKNVIICVERCDSDVINTV